mmetsp:Transcript_2596/g.4604  ORF Transcript_2596/g.4604 Transcript_2596/m.4604 type:complete len:206 (-) Transcript_2596:1459-2076(-)
MKNRFPLGWENESHCLTSTSSKSCYSKFILTGEFPTQTNVIHWPRFSLQKRPHPLPKRVERQEGFRKRYLKQIRRVELLLVRRETHVDQSGATTRASKNDDWIIGKLSLLNHFFSEADGFHPRTNAVEEREQHKIHCPDPELPPLNLSSVLPHHWKELPCRPATEKVVFRGSIQSTCLVFEPNKKLSPWLGFSDWDRRHDHSCDG